jgi:isopenicillin N synthase-like dioxygenase
MGNIDRAFIQEQEHRPKLSTNEAEGIPLINLSENDTESVVKVIGNACKNWGFFQVVNHGVALDIREKLELCSRRFFEQDLQEKNKVSRDEVKVMGYYDTEHTKNVRDWKQVFDFTIENPTLIPASIHPSHDLEVTQWYNQWPDYPPQFREACEEYGKEVEKLAFKLMELIALSLGLSKERLNRYFKEQTSFVRLNYYPPCPEPHLALGVGRHKDAGALTILSQDDVGGLEVKRKSDGQWIRIKPTPNAYIINVGDIIQVWSNEAYESVEHRVVVNTDKERFSIPFFFNPSHYTMVKPMEELTCTESPPKYRPYNWGKFFVTRKGSNFQKLHVDNIQIAHFKISQTQSEFERLTI